MDSVFGIGAPELVLILIIAGIVMGPERIGRAARWLGKTSAQLQTISRSFVQQLNNELDGADASGELRGAMAEVNDLRKELAQLRNEMVAATSQSVNESKQILEETKAELENSIAPPIMGAPSVENGANGENGSNSAEVSPDTAENTIAPPPPPVLPKRVSVADDPEK